MAMSGIVGGSALAVALLLAGPLAAGGASAQGTGPARCYFGECAGQKPAAAPEPAPQPSPPPPAYSPPIEGSVDANQQLEQYLQQLQSLAPAQAAAPVVASMCLTMVGATCWMAEAIPVGSSCVCPSVYGPLFGIAQ